MRKLIACIAALGLLAGASATASVTTLAPTLTARRGQVLYVPFQLQTSSGEAVAGVNGQINYDSNLFHSPEIQIGPNGFPNFIALGNEISPGKVRFVVYADPARQLGVETPTMYLKLTAAGNLPTTGQTTITYINGPLGSGDPNFAAQSAASSPAGVSLPSVSFSAITVALNTSAASDWMMYP